MSPRLGSATKPLLVIVPACNEAVNLPWVLRPLLDRQGADVLVVDDGSTDDTAATASAMGVSVISHGANRGYGAALVSGYAHAQRAGYPFVVQMDADGQHDPRQIDRLLAPLERGEADVVVGSRMAPGGGHSASPARLVGILFFAWLGRRLTGRQITDPTSGFIAMNVRGMAFLSQNTPDDFPDLNVLVALHRAEIRTMEVPVTMAARRAGESQLRGLRPLMYVPKMFYYLQRVYRTDVNGRPRVPR
jgi:glycosyltransferase involved in cell wall biosynthesis